MNKSFPLLLGWVYGQELWLWCTLGNCLFFFWLCLVILVSGFSLVAGRAQALGHTGSVVVAWGLLLAACGILVPWPGIELKSPALEWWFLTTGPPGKSWWAIYSQREISMYCSIPFNPYKNSDVVVLSFSFYRWGNWNLEIWDRPHNLTDGKIFICFSTMRIRAGLGLCRCQVMLPLERAMSQSGH